MKRLMGRVGCALIMVGVALLFIVCGTEWIRVMWAEQIVEQAAKFGVRYATTLNYDFVFCTALCDTRAQQHRARLLSVYQIVRRVMSNFPVDKNASDIEPGYLKITVCSNRLGHAYDSQNDACFPKDDAGDDGDRVMVSVTYNYPVGSSLGLSLYKITFHAFYQGVNEHMGLGNVVLQLSPTPTPIVPAIVPTEDCIRSSALPCCQ